METNRVLPEELISGLTGEPVQTDQTNEEIENAAEMIYVNGPENDC